MTDNSYKYIKYSRNEMLSNNAFNYTLNADFIDPKYRSVFEIYNINGDEMLDTSELAQLKDDIDAACMIDGDYQNLSKRETNSFLQRFFPNMKISRGLLYGFFQEIQFNYEATIKLISDGKIDYTEQGEEGDCWLLSEVRALSGTEWGAKAIKDSISDDFDAQVYTITLKGVNFTCQISYDEIETERDKPNRCQGDIDMLLLEIATERYFRQEVEAGRMDRDIDDLLASGASVGKETMAYLLTGNVGHNFMFYSERLTQEEIITGSEEIKQNSKVYSHFKENLNNHSDLYGRKAQEQFIRMIADKTKEYALVCSFNSPDDWINSEKYSTEEKSDDFNTTDCHEYTIEDIVMDTNGNIYDIILNNPDDPDVRIHKSLEEFLDQCLDVSVYDKNDNYDDLVRIAEPCWIRL